MSGYGNVVKGLAGASLTASQYLFVYRDGTDGERFKVLSSLTDRESFAGVLQNAPADEERASVIPFGYTLVKAGGAIEDGDPITNDATGKAIKATGGAPIRGYYVAEDSNTDGTSRDAADGDLIRVLLTAPPAAPIGIISATATIDFASIADGDEETATATVTGAAVGDVALVSCESLTDGLGLTANVTGADEVTILAFNNSGGAIDQASDTYHIKVIKA